MHIRLRRDGVRTSRRPGITRVGNSQAIAFKSRDMNCPHCSTIIIDDGSIRPGEVVACGACGGHFRLGPSVPVAQPTLPQAPPLPPTTPPISVPAGFEVSIAQSQRASPVRTHSARGSRIGWMMHLLCGIFCCGLGLALFMLARAHSPHLSLLELVAVAHENPEHWVLKEPYYSGALFVAVGLGIGGIIEITFALYAGSRQQRVSGRVPMLIGLVLLLVVGGVAVVVALARGDQRASATKVQAAIVGKWKEVGKETIVEFFKNGTFTIHGKEHIAGRYEFLDATRLRLHFDGPHALRGSHVLENISIAGDILTVKTPDGEVTRSKRIR